MRIQTLLSEAQGGQAFANLARAFHLPPEKVEIAVDVMVGELAVHLHRCLRARQPLAALVELLGQKDHEQVLETPTLLGATHTQVIGNEALNVIAGHDDIHRMVSHAAKTADVSEMIAEYLLPAVASMLVGALAKASRAGLEEVMGHIAPANGTGGAQGEGGIASPQFPLVAGGVGFSGSTGGTIAIAHVTTTPSQFLELADDIRRTDHAPDAADPAQEVRAVLSPLLGMQPAVADWLRLIRAWSTDALNAFFAGWKR